MYSSYCLDKCSLLSRILTFVANSELILWQSFHNLPISADLSYLTANCAVFLTIWITCHTTTGKAQVEQLLYQETLFFFIIKKTEIQHKNQLFQAFYGLNWIQHLTLFSTSFRHFTAGVPWDIYGSWHANKPKRLWRINVDRVCLSLSRGSFNIRHFLKGGVKKSHQVKQSHRPPIVTPLSPAAPAASSPAPVSCNIIQTTLLLMGIHTSHSTKYTDTRPC